MPDPKDLDSVDVEGATLQGHAPSMSADPALAQTHAAVSTGSTPRRVDVEPPTLNDVVFDGRYEMRKVLGAGGMGEVRLYRDQRIGRDVAVKFLHGGASASGSAVDRFVREARVQGQLEHPTVVPVYDLGVSLDGAPFFSMKRVRGQTLEAVLARLSAGEPEALQRYTRRRLLSAFANVCLAIDFAHEHGVLHRDLKPANVMLGDFGEVHVLDWGVAKIIGAKDLDGGEGVQPDDANRAATAMGSLVGTPGYMSPEQVRGDLDKLDARSDVYALGAMLFEILALTRLHSAHTIADVLVSTLDGVEGRPSVRVPSRDIPPELDAICVRAVALDPAKRFVTARALGEEVERFLDGDRDLERRRALASEHLARARSLLAAASGRGTAAHEARDAAMREATRALAFDPDATDAAAVLAQLMMDVPDDMPAEAERELASSTVKTQRGAGWLASGRALAMLVIIPLVATMGIRMWSGVAAVAGALALSAVFNLYWWRGHNGASDHWSGRAALLCSVVALSGVSLAFGHFILVPLLALFNAMLFAIQTDFRMRRLLFACAPLPVLLPWLAERLGWLPRAYVYSSNHIAIVSRLVHFPAWPTEAVLLLFHIGMCTVPLVVLTRLRTALARSERRLFMHSWHLRRLAPSVAGKHSDSALLSASRDRR